MQPVAAQNSGPPASPTQSGPPPIRVPPLTPDKVGKYSALFEKSGSENGMLPGPVAKQIFERAGLPNEVLGRIWNLSDSQGRGALDTREFVIAMHLLASYKAGVMRGVPNTLPPGLYEAAARKAPVRTSTGSRPGPTMPPSAGLQPQFSGFGSARPQSPVTRQQVGTPLSAQSTGEGWLIGPSDKAKFDQLFAGLDRSNRGFITGEQAVGFFGEARLPEEVLAQIWDLADIRSEGQLDKDEFAVAMYLIRQQRGSKDGHSNLPSTLPPALIPPSFRRQQMPPSQPTAPAFENAVVTQPRSAADDLFGLDAFSSPAPAQVQHSTGGSAGGPFQTTRSPPGSTQIPQSTGGSVGGPFPAPTSPQLPTAASTFKPFVPSSSFGQSLAPQSTGAAATSQSRSLAADDLLGDADPEVSARLTNETSELANLSNQVGNLSTQMTEVHGDRAKAEQDLAQNVQQKREFETRLTQLRTAYEQEVKDVKALQERLTISKAETKRLQQDMAMIDGSHQDLQTQHQQVTAALDTDQRENAALKEKIRQMNVEVTQLKPQLEKLKSDARQQKGLVAINRKQLATNEAERDRLQAELAAAQKEHEEAIHEAEQTARELEQSSKEVEQARSVPQPVIVSPSRVVSPTPSTSSNPFFRRTTSGPTDNTFSPSSINREAVPEDQNSFDSIFGPSFPVSSTGAAAVPSVSFPTERPSQAREAPVEEGSALKTPPRSFSGFPDAAEPPEPPQSRQITSAALPFRTPLDRGDSVSSSVRVAPPASRVSPAVTPGTNTPSGSTSSPFNHDGLHDSLDHSEGREHGTDEESSSFEQATPTASTADQDPLHEVFGRPSTRLGDIPGAFPGSRSATPQPESHSGGMTAGAGVATLAAGAGIAAAATHVLDKPEESGVNQAGATERSSSNRDSNFDNFFGGPAHSRSDSEKAADLDSAFTTNTLSPATNGDANTSNREFPPIHELDDADDSDESSEAPMAFDDNFNTTSPPRPPKLPQSEPSTSEPKEIASAVPAYLQAPRPAYETTPSGDSSLPGINSAEVQNSPPGYDESVPPNDPSHFPPEFTGLLPRREDPTSPPPTAGGVNSETATASHVQPNYGPELGHPQRQFTTDDFDSAFAGMNTSAAPVEDDEDEEDAFDFGLSSSHHHTESDFDPTFDSPRQSKSTTANTAPPTSIYASVTNGAASSNDTHNAGNAVSNSLFSSGSGPPPATTPSSVPSSATTARNPAHDWDAIFAGLDAPPPAKSSEFPAAAPVATTAPEPASPTSTASRVTAAMGFASPQPKVTRPTPGRALSEGTEHDDPILKRLTSMGWSRNESLDALEKFDYNIDKVRLHDGWNVS